MMGNNRRRMGVFSLVSHLNRYCTAVVSVLAAMALMMSLGPVAHADETTPAGSERSIAEDAGRTANRDSGMSAAAATSVTMPNYYSDGMVLQRGKPIVIRGKADAPNARIKVTLKGRTSAAVTTVADATGFFETELPSLDASLEPYELSILSGDTSLRQFSDVYIGDVFIAAGQSNMMINYAEDYADASSLQENARGLFDADDLPDLVTSSSIRYLREGDVTSVGNSLDVPLHPASSNGWRSASDGAQYLGYLPQLFAQQLAVKNPGVPVGIIQTAWGGTEIDRHVKGGDIYESHIAPLEGLNVAGVLWYQGESDATYDQWAVNYKQRFLTLISQYRDAFQDADLPFIYVQIARYSGNKYSAQIRQDQLDALNEAANTHNLGMVVSIDTDKGTDEVIHPLGKDILAKRMADQWNAMDAGLPVPSGPVAQQAVTDGPGAVTVSFRNGTATGLKVMAPLYSTAATSDHMAEASSQELTGFEVAGDDGVFTPAAASIHGDAIVVTSQQVMDIRQIRYQYQNDPSVTTLLYNGDDLPASPFLLDVDSPTAPVVAWRASGKGDYAVHRLYNRHSGAHSFTADSSELAHMTQNGWTDEGISFKADTKGPEVYRLYDPSSGTHYFTTSTDERDRLSTQDGWRYEGVAWHASSDGAMPIYRAYYESAHEYIWTTSREEYLRIAQ